MDHGTPSSSIAAVQEVSQRRVQQLYKQYKDNGSEFSSHGKHKKEGSTGIFQKHLEQYGIKHITTSVNHPQTNGKLEKWFDLYERRRDEFDTLDGFIGWYNDKRPHASLDFENAETPSEVFTRKFRVIRH